MKYIAACFEEYASQCIGNKNIKKFVTAGTYMPQKELRIK